MRSELTFNIADARPNQADVLALQGVPRDRAVDDRTARLFTDALDRLNSLAKPAGVLLEIDEPTFENVYHGAGHNAERTPIGDIFSLADALALFAVTLGPAVTDELRVCFDRGALALGAMLDAAASCAADNIATLTEQRFTDLLRDGGRLTPDTRVLGYSPGYCGWDITAQRRLFATLQPEQIGIQLGETCLMEPLKSVSGVLVAGPTQIHAFEMVYPQCRTCTQHSCRQRNGQSHAG